MKVTLDHPVRVALQRPLLPVLVILLCALSSAGCGTDDADDDPEADDTSSESVQSTPSAPSSSSTPTPTDDSLDDKCQQAAAGTLEILNPKWRKLVLKPDFQGAKEIGASGWILLFEEAEGVMQSQGCTADLDYLAPLTASVEAFNISLQGGFPNFDAITDTLNDLSQDFGVKAP